LPKVHALIDAALQCQGQGQGEAVGWQFRGRLASGEISEWCYLPLHLAEHEKERHPECEFRPLYTTPPSHPAEATREPQLGWLFFNEDTGTEWSESHPVRSGECPDAKDIKPATLQNLKDELFVAWQGWEEARREEPKQTAEPSREPQPDGQVREALGAADWCGKQAEYCERAAATLTSDFLVKKSRIQAATFREAEKHFRASTPPAQGLVDAGEWLPIETAPKDGTDILLWCPLPGSEYSVVGKLCDGWWQSSYEGEDVFNPSHWMPLPAPPANRGGA
jgi:hypothetical protein